jgi:hypothetical protein
MAEGRGRWQPAFPVPADRIKRNIDEVADDHLRMNGGPGSSLAAPGETRKAWLAARAIFREIGDPVPAMSRIALITTGRGLRPRRGG